MCMRESRFPYFNGILVWHAVGAVVRLQTNGCWWVLDLAAKAAHVGPSGPNDLKYYTSRASFNNLMISLHSWTGNSNTMSWPVSFL